MASDRYTPADDDLATAAERVLEFVNWFGSGRIDHAIDGSETPPPLVSRDLEVLARYAQEARACRHDSSSGANGRWRCDQCGADCGPDTYLTEESR